MRRKGKIIYLGYMLGFVVFMLAGLFGLAYLHGEDPQKSFSAVGVVLLITLLGIVIGFVVIGQMTFPDDK